MTQSTAAAAAGATAVVAAGVRATAAARVTTKTRFIP